MTSGAEQAAAAARAAKERAGSLAGHPRPAKPPTIIGGIFASIFTKESGMSKYSKLIAALSGSVVGAVVSVIFGFLISHGLGSCVITDPQIGEVCSVAGYTQSQVTTWLMAIVMTYLAGQFTYSFPPNTKVVSTAKK